MRVLVPAVIVLLIVYSCKGPELINRYNRKIQECIELRIADKNDFYGLKSYSTAEGGFKRILREFEETLLAIEVLEAKNEIGYKKLIKSINQVAFNKHLESQKLNSIQESFGMFTVNYTQTCPAITLNESLNHRKVIAYKTILDRLPVEFEMGIPNKQYLYDFQEFVNFDNDDSRLFYVYLIFLNLKYSNN